MKTLRNTITRIFVLALVLFQFIFMPAQDVLPDYAPGAAGDGRPVPAVAVVVSEERQAILNTLNIKEENAGWDYAPFYQALELVPDEVLKNFGDQKWTLYFGNVHINTYAESKSLEITPTGLTYSKTHRIYVSASTSIVHEMGHYVAVSNPEIQEQKEVLYEQEVENSKQFLRKYEYSSGADEYVAGYCACLFKHQNDTEYLNALQAATPDTYALFEKVAANGWIPAPARTETPAATPV